MTYKSIIDWDDPVARARLIERLGHEAYNKAQAEHIERTVVATVNGYKIRPVQTRFGRLFFIMGMDIAFQTLAEAEAHAAKDAEQA